MNVVFGHDPNTEKNHPQTTKWQYLKPLAVRINLSWCYLWSDRFIFSSWHEINYKKPKTLRNSVINIYLGRQLLFPDSGITHQCVHLYSYWSVKHRVDINHKITLHETHALGIRWVFNTFPHAPLCRLEFALDAHTPLLTHPCPDSHVQNYSTSYLN